MTAVSYALITMHCGFIVMLCGFTILTYSISYYWGNKEMLTIAPICLLTLHFRSIITATVNPPYAKQ